MTPLRRKCHILAIPCKLRQSRSEHCIYYGVNMSKSRSYLHVDVNRVVNTMLISHLYINCGGKCDSKNITGLHVKQI